MNDEKLQNKHSIQTLAETLALSHTHTPIYDHMMMLVMM